MHDDPLEDRVVPKHEPHQLLAVAEHLGQFGLGAFLAFARDPQQRLANGLVLLGRTDHIGGQHREPERVEFGDVLQEMQLLQFPVERRQGFRRGPVFDLHSIEYTFASKSGALL